MEYPMKSFWALYSCKKINRTFGASVLPFGSANAGVPSGVRGIQSVAAGQQVVTTASRAERQCNPLPLFPIAEKIEATSVLGPLCKDIQNNASESVQPTEDLLRPPGKFYTGLSFNLVSSIVAFPPRIAFTDMVHVQIATKSEI